MNTFGRAAGWTSAVALLFASAAGVAQQVERGVSVVSEEVAGQLEAFSYREGPESKLDFRGTAIALAADGKGDVEFQAGRATVDVSVRKLPDPASLGPYTTYVLWAVTADGRANNLGSFEIRDGRGLLKTSTPLSQFALIVSAEPHFAVTAPSKAVVLRNLARRVKGQRFMITGLTERMDYAGLAKQTVPARSRIPADLIQARYALDIARAAKAGEFAAEDLAQAEQRLQAAETAQASRKSRERRTAPRLAREAVQMAEDARRAAVEAETEARLARVAREAAEQKAQREAELAREAAAVREREAADRATMEANAQARADLVRRLSRVLPTRETERGIVAEIAGVQFATGAATLSPSAREALARFAGIVSVYPAMRFKVEGHTDDTGSYMTNRELSLKRAMSVRDYLMVQYVPSTAIDIEGMGPDRPIADNYTADGRARNRRVEIVLTGGPITAAR